MEVSKEFVLSAHRAACPDWKAKIEVEFPELFPTIKDSIKELPSYAMFVRESYSEKSFKFDGGRISIQLPKDNPTWSLAAYALAIDICREFGYGPVHGRYIAESDLFDVDDTISEVIVLIKR